MTSSSELASIPAVLTRLTILEIDVTAIRVPLRSTYRGSHYRMTHRSTMLVRVVTEEGVVGQAYVGDEDGSLAEITGIVRTEIAPALIGEDAFAVERCWQLARPATFDILRDRRLGLVAAAGVDAAIWDAIGVALGHPLWRLWGGFRDRVPIISIGGYYGGELSIEAEVADLLERGVAGMKFKVGGLTPEEDAERLRRARKAAGDDFLLAADGNQGWNTADAIRFARLVEDCDLLWFEEPCRWGSDRRAMRDVRYGAGIAICAGQSELSAAGCLDLMAEGAIDYCNFDSSWSGGITEWRRVAGMAVAFDVKMAHHEEPHIAGHLLASIAHGTFAECFHPDRDPIFWSILSNRAPLDEGCLVLPSTPGFGWEYDLDYIERYRVESI